MIKYHMGRSDISVKPTTIKKLFGLAMILVSCQISVTAMAYAGVLTGLFCSLGSAFPNRKLLGYSYFEQLKDISPYVGMSAIMAGIVY